MHSRHAETKVEGMKLQIVTINLPNQYLDSIETLVNLGFFPSRSEAVRQALKEFLEREYKFNVDLDPKHFKQLKEQQMEHIVHYK